MICYDIKVDGYLINSQEKFNDRRKKECIGNLRVQRGFSPFTPLTIAVNYCFYFIYIFIGDRFRYIRGYSFRINPAKRHIGIRQD
jgi:hypothetical protein